MGILQTKEGLKMIKSIKTALWQIICSEGIEVTNQNIDWLLERAWKSVEKEASKDVRHSEREEGD